MEILTSPNTFQILIAMISGLLFCLVAGVLCLLSIRIYRNARWTIWSRHLNMDEEIIFAYMNEEISLDDIQLRKTAVTRNYIANLCESVGGTDQLKLNLLYQHLGFLLQDVKYLRFGTIRQKSEALARCRQLEISLPDIGWIYLLSHKSLTYRWAVMEYLIATKGSHALFWLMSFLVDPKNHRQGVILHLLSCLAENSPESLLAVLGHTEDELIIEQCLRTLAVYPNTDAEDLITQHLYNTTSDETFIAAIKALGAVPSDRTLEIFSVAINHHHWVVRLEIARSLVHFPEDECCRLMEFLLNDPIYHVRKKAYESAIVLNDLTKGLIDDIHMNPDHPAYEFTVQLPQHEEVA